MTACARRDDAGSYVLHALPDDEHERFEAHLATCADCRREVADLQVAADTLPLAAVQVGPPPELRDRIMSIVRSEAELLSTPIGTIKGRMRLGLEKMRNALAGSTGENRGITA